jgi:hypothetical protein
MRSAKGESGNPKGRPPKLVSSLVKELKDAGYERVGPSSITHLFETVLSMPENKLRELVKDEDQPLSVRIVTRSLLSSKGFAIMEAVLDRAHGKPKQQMDVTGVNAAAPVINVVVQAPRADDGIDT